MHAINSYIVLVKRTNNCATIGRKYKIKVDVNWCLNLKFVDNINLGK